jgi:hypothetical protein
MTLQPKSRPQKKKADLTAYEEDPMHAALLHLLEPEHQLLRF